MGGFARVRENLFSILLVLIVANILLTVFDIIPKEYMWFFIWLVVGIEVLFFITVILKITKVVGKYRSTRSMGYSGFESLQQALEDAIPKLAAKLLTTELILYYTLYLSLKGQSRQPALDRYPSKLSNYGFFIKAIVVVCLIELAALSFVLPDYWKVIHLILGVWAIMWLIADYNAMKFYTHEFRNDGIKMQMGLRCSGFAPFELISSIQQTGKAVPDFSLGPIVPKSEPDNLYFSTGENCNVLIELKEPLIFQGLVKDFTGIQRVWLSIEDPDTFYSRVLKVLSKTNKAED